MAKRNILNWNNIAGYSEYGDSFETEADKRVKKRKQQLALDKQRENASLGKKVLGTTVDVTGNILLGGYSAAEGVSDWARYRGADILDFFGADNKAEKIRERARQNDTEDIATSFKHIVQGDFNRSKTDEEINRNDFVTKNSLIDEDTTWFGANSRGILQGIGNTLGYAAMTGMLGGATAGINTAAKGGKALKAVGDLAPIYLSAAGGGQTEAYNEGANNKQAAIYGTLSGGVEAISESLFGGLGEVANKLGISSSLGLGKGALDDQLINGLTSRFKSTLAKNLVDLGMRSAGEGFEEVFSGLGDAFLKKMTYMSDKELKDLIKDQNLMESFVSGTLSSFLTQAPTNVKATIQGREAATGITKNENKVIEAEVEERTKGKELSKKEINEIRKEVREDLQNGYISTDMIENTLGKDYDRSNDTYLQESYNERARRQTSFNTDLSQYKNENQRNIVQKAIDSGILNDSKKTHNFVDLVSKIAADKGMDFDFVNNQKIAESGFGVEGKTVNGYVNGNTIGLNIESNNALNKTVGHEITHILEGSDLYQALQDSLKNYVGEDTWNKRIKELSETYKNVENADVTKELTADLVGENLFNNEDFVRNLSTKNMNLFEKIFNEIKYMVKIATAGSKEKRDLVKLQKTFENVYRDSKTTKEGTQYSIKESKQMLEKQFKELTGDSKLVADAKIGRYAFQQMQGNEVEAPYSKEAMELYEKIENSRKTSSHLYHSTPADRIQSIVKNGLQVGSQQNQEGVSSADKLYLSATEELADSFTPEGSVMLRISPNANLENLDNDLLGGEGSYTITNNIDPKYLQVKENGKWVNLLKSQYAKQNNQNTRYSLSVQEANTTQDNEGRKLTDNQLAYFKDSKATDENGNLITVYHTTTGYNNQFNEFNPVGTPGYKYGNSIVNFYTESKEMSSSYGNNLISPNTTKIETMDDVNKLLGDRFRVEEKDGKYELYDKFEEKQIDNYKELIKLFSEEEQKILNKTFNKSRGDLLNKFTNEEFDFYDKTRKKFLNMFYKYNTYTGIENNQVNRNFDEIIEDYLKNKKLSPYKTYNNQNELFRGITSATSPYEHYQYEGYLNLTNPYVLDAEGRNWNDIIKGENETSKTMYESLSEEEKTEMTKLAELTDDMYNSFEDKYLGFYQRLLSNNEGLYDKVTNDNSIKEKLYTAALNNWDEKSVRDLIGKRNTTNDFVKQILEMNKNGANYDGVIFNNLTDYGANTTDKDTSIANNVYVTFNSNQFKAVDNLNPTEDADIRYQLGTNDIAPTRGWDVRGRDIALKSAIAPLQEQVQQLQNTIEDLRDNIAPITEKEVDNLPTDENIQPPTRYNLTEQESKRLDFLDNLERNNMLTENLAEERNELMAKEENAPVGEDMTPIESLTDVRDIDEVGDRKVKAYQYEHPEVKPYFQEEARNMLRDLNNSTKGERYAIPGQSQNINEWEWIGLKRNTSPEIEMLLDGDLGASYTYDEIRKGLNAIIEDHGAENIAVAKRIEFLLDERLRNGYDEWGVMDENYEPYHVEPNQDYLNMLRQQSWEKYYEQNPWLENAPAEIEEPVIRMTPEEVSRTENIAPVREITEMVDNEINRKSTTYNQPRQIKKERSALRRFRDTFEGAFINRNVHQDNLARETGNRAIKHKADMLSNVMGEVGYDINDYQTNNQGQAIGKGIKGLFAEANSQGLGEAFNDFLINYSNIDRYKQGKGSQTPLEVSKRLVRDYAIQYPEFKKWAKEVWNWSKNERQNLVDAGLIDQELADNLERIYPHYVPYVSDYDNADTYFEGVGELKPKGLKRAKGGAGKLLSVQDAMARYTYAQKNAVRTNELYSEIVDTLGTVPSFGIDERTDYTDMKDTLYKDSKGQYLTAYRDGRQITTQINAELYNELSKNFENQVKNFEKNMELVLKPIQKINEIRRNILTTWSPTFPVTNAIKDIQDALLNSKHTMDMVKNYPSAIKELATMKTDQVKQFVALYGSGLTMGEFGNDTMNQKTNNIKFLNKIKRANEIIELAPRYAEFKASLQNGASLPEAMYNAREVTTNFGRGGVLTKAANTYGATFLNASVQGFDKLIRNFSGENGAKGIVNSLMKVAALGVAPALFNHLVFGGNDDEEYEALPDYIKDNYYLIKLNDDGDFLRIPKGRMLSVFGSAARRTLEATEGRENAFKGFLENAWNQTGVNNPADNNLFAPLFQAYGSKNGTAWYGGDIIPTRLQDKPAEDQYDESTDKFSIWLGQKLGISPYKLNYVIDQYTGGLGDIVLPTITEEATSDGNLLAPIKDKFVTNSTTKNKYVSDFYSKREEVTKKANGSKATDEDKLQQKYLDDISWEMSALYKEKREIQNDSDLTKKEKFERSQEIKKEINRLAKEGLDNYKDVSQTGSYSEVSGNEYQKTSEGWKKVKDDESTEINSYGLDSSERNTYFKTKSNISNIKTEYKGSKDYAGKKSSIINEIRSSNLPDDAKIGLYQDTYNDKTAQYYVDAGIKADDYLDFKSQTFTADKDKNGKSISGSKKKKVFDYINSMNIPFEQKVMLVKTEYPSYNEYNRQIINYINNSGLNYEEVSELLKDMGFEVNGNNVTW